MSQITKIIFGVGAVLLVYGYLCRAFNIYFFWDSKALGWFIMAFGLIAYLISLNRYRTERGKKTFWIKMAIGGIIFALVLSLSIIFEFKRNSEPYQIAIEYLSTDSLIQKEVGRINGFGLVPTGSQTTTTINGAQSGIAAFFLTVRGSLKYKDVKIKLEKSPETNWTVMYVK